MEYHNNLHFYVQYDTASLKVHETCLKWNLGIMGSCF